MAISTLAWAMVALQMVLVYGHSGPFLVAHGGKSTRSVVFAISRLRNQSSSPASSREPMISWSLSVSLQPAHRGFTASHPLSSGATILYGRGGGEEEEGEEEEEEKEKEEE